MPASDPDHEIDSAETPRPAPTDALLRRSYRTGAVVALLAALYGWAQAGSAGGWGVVFGYALSFFSLWTVHWMVQRMIRAKDGLSASVLLLFGGKQIVLLALLAGAAAGVVRGWMSPFWLLAGFTLLHLVIVLKLAGRALIAATERPGPK